MSVHGEYARALAGVIEALERFESSGATTADAWRRAFRAAEVDATRDLSTAARAALARIAELDASLAGPTGAGSAAAEIEPLREACRHLQAHCHAILGVGRDASTGVRNVALRPAGS